MCDKSVYLNSCTRVTHKFYSFFPENIRVYNHYCNFATFVIYRIKFMLFVVITNLLTLRSLWSIFSAVYIQLLVFLISEIIHHFYYHILSFTIMCSRLIYVACHFIPFYHKTVFYLTYIDCFPNPFLSWWTLCPR